LQIHGYANIFFRTGAIIRGHFENNTLHGKCILTLPFDIIYFLNFVKGEFEKKNYMINLKNQEITQFTFENGDFKNEKEINLTIQDFINSKITSKGVFKHNWMPKPIHQYTQGTFFGSCIIKNDITFHGLIKNGEPLGWGIFLTVNAKESNFIFYYSFKINFNKR
jgi:hypothetical protein